MIVFTSTGDNSSSPDKVVFIRAHCYFDDVGLTVVKNFPLSRYFKVAVYSWFCLIE